MKRYLLIMALVVAGSALIIGQFGCGGGDDYAGRPRTGTIALGVIFPPRPSQMSPAAGEGLPDATNSVRITISGATGAGGGTEPWTREALLVRPVGGGAVQTQFQNIPVGSCTVLAQAHGTNDGTGQIIAEAQTNAAVTSGNTTNVTMTVDTLAITVDIPATLNMEYGQSVNVTPVALDADGNACINVSYAWTNTAPSVVSVPATGSSVTFSALADGSADVTVRDSRSGEQDTCRVNVVTRAPVRVALSPASATLYLQGDPRTVQINATALDAADQPISYAVITFASVSDTVASVSPTGLVTANGSGVSSITVTATTPTGTAQAIFPVVVTDTGRLGIIVR
jgi:hypothetical protein